MQTVASAAGTFSSIIFVLPGLIMIGWWTEFPFWISFLICALGGILGVMYSIPLRRALVTNSDLPYPEGVACAEVLKVGSSGDKQRRRRGTRPRRVCSRCCGDRSSRRSSRSSSRRKYSRRMSRRHSASGNAARSAAMISRFPSRCSRSVICVGLVGRHRDVDRRIDRLGLARAVLLRADRRPHDAAAALAADAPGARKCASSARARSASPRSGRC